MFTKMYEYRFFLLDFVAITRKNLKIKEHYSELSKRRVLEFLQIVEVLIQRSTFREERLTNEYQGLFKRIEVMSNFWFSSVLIQANTLSADCVKEYQLMIIQSIYPYLTVRGREQYALTFPELMC